MAEVIVYSTDSCPWCRKVEEYLQMNNIDFNVKKVDQDREAAMEMVQTSGQQGVPVVLIDGSMIVGFNKAEIDKALGL
ncbi:MAG: glutaredoxin family protein [Nanoarchaeota archaeon]